MIHVPDMTAARAVRDQWLCCPQPDHVDLECPTCRNQAVPVKVGRLSPPENAECPRFEGAGTVTACQHCGFVESATRVTDCDDWTGEDVVAHHTKTRRV